MRYILALLCAALLFGCNEINGIFGSSDEAEFYTDRAQYGSADAITVTLSNRTEEKVLGYNLCSSTLEVYRSGRWQASALQEDWVCTAALYLLDPDKQASFVFDFEQAMPAGLYRFRTAVAINGSEERMELITNEFRVR